MDKLLRGISQEHKIRFVYVDVTTAAKELERRHLSGPTAGQILAQGLCAAALLSADSSSDDERICVQLKSDGPIGGVLAEASGAGILRGYSNEKVLNQFDCLEDPDVKSAMGEHGFFGAIKSNSKATLSSGQVTAEPPDVQHNLAKYCNQSLQVPTGVEIFSSCKDGYIESARALMAEKMPDADTPAFVRVLEVFNDGHVRKILEEGDVQKFAECLELPDLKFSEERDLKFGCRCSYEKTLNILSSLSKDELKEVAESSDPQVVTCHFCGESYRIQQDDIRKLMVRKVSRLD